MMLGMHEQMNGGRHTCMVSCMLHPRCPAFLWPIRHRQVLFLVIDPTDPGHSPQRTVFPLIPQPLAAVSFFLFSAVYSSCIDVNANRTVLLNARFPAAGFSSLKSTRHLRAFQAGARGAGTAYVIVDPLPCFHMGTGSCLMKEIASGDGADGPNFGSSFGGSAFGGSGTIHSRDGGPILGMASGPLSHGSVILGGAGGTAPGVPGTTVNHAV
jgi:hypothetical protein